MTDWYDYEKKEMVVLPPVGTKCLYSLLGDRHEHTWFECEVISIHHLVLKCPHVVSDEHNGLQVFKSQKVYFRPLDWENGNLRFKIIDNVAQIIYDRTFMTRDKCLDIAKKLYDLGYLKFPEDKQYG